MTKKIRGIIVASIIVVAVGIALIINYFLSPQASELSTAQSRESTVAWGYVTDENGQPLPDIRLTIGNTGTISGPNGGYIIFTNEIGRLPVEFRKSSTNELFLLEDSNESQVFITPGESNNFNFQIKKSDIQPTPIVVLPGQLPTTTASPLVIPSIVPTGTPTPTSTPAPKPAQPTNLTAVAKAKPSRIELKWRDNATNESGFTLVRTEAKTFLVKLIDIPANTTSYNDTTVEKGKTYFYRVRAYSGSGSTKSYSALSNERKVKAK